MKKPPVYISMPRRDGALYSIALLGVACAFLSGMKYMQSELAVTGMFLLATVFLFIGGIGIYSLLSKNFFYGKYDYKVTVTKTDITILESVTGKQETIPWANIVSIATWTRKEPFDDNMGSGDYAYQYHWCLTGNDGTDVTIPFHSAGCNAFVERLKTTPYIDHAKLHAAMNGEKEGFTVIWQKQHT